MDARRKIISIVTPCFNEQDNVIPCYEAVRHVFEEQLPDYDFEHVFCDNASTDNTPEVLRQMAANDPRVKVILNARNFGPFCSTFNGLLSTTGDAVVVLLAADLQDPPEVVAEFVRKWEKGYQVVYGIRSKREEGFLMRSVRSFYYRTVSRFANITIPPDVGEFQLIDRAVVEALKKFDDFYPYIRGMIASCGFRTAGVEYVWKAQERLIQESPLPPDRSRLERDDFLHPRAHAALYVRRVSSRGTKHFLRAVLSGLAPDRQRPSGSSRHSHTDCCRVFFLGHPVVFLRHSGRIRECDSLPGSQTTPGDRARADKLCQRPGNPLSISRAA